MFVDFNILNQLGSPSINSNTFANRPSAGQVGRLFVSTDTFEIYRDNGTGWDLIGGPGSSTVTGNGAAGQVTYWTGTNSVGGNNNLFWDIANERLGIGTTTPSSKVDIAGSNVLLHLKGGSNAYMMYHGNGVDEYQVGYTDGPTDYRRFSIYDQSGAKETITIDKQSRNVGVNYQYSSLADQPAYTFDVSGSGRFTDSAYFVSSGAGQVGINTTSPTATALVQANKTDGYGLYLNYTTNTGSGTTATALWTLNTTNGSGFSAVIEEKTPNTTSGQYPLAIKHSLTTGTAGVGMGTGIHFQLPDDAGNFKTTQLTIETTDAAAATYTSRYRFMAQVNNSSTPLAYLTSVGLGIGNVIPAYKLDVNGTVRAFGVGNTGNFLAVDTNPGGASVNLNPQYGTGLPILYTNGAFPLLLGTNNTENARFTTGGNFLINTQTDVGAKIAMNGYMYISNRPLAQIVFNSTGTYYGQIQNDASDKWSFARNTSNNGSLSTSIMTWDAANLRVGINNTSPNTFLQINGSPDINWGHLSLFDSRSAAIDQGGVITFSGYKTTTSAAAIFGKIAGNKENATAGNEAGYLAFFTNNNTNYFERMRITSAGLVGIGTSTPTNILQTYGSAITVNDESTYSARFSNNSNKGVVIGYDTTNNRGHIGSVSPGVAWTSTVINANGGNLLVGTTSDVARLTVKGGNSNANFEVDNGSDYIYLQSYDRVAATHRDMYFYTTGPATMILKNSGNVLIGTTTDSGEKLQVNGTVKATTITDGFITIGAAQINRVGSIVELQFPGSGDVRMFGNTANNINFLTNGEIQTNSSIKTGTPNGGTSGKWKFGSRVAATVVLSTSQYIELDVNGTLYKLAIVT